MVRRQAAAAALAGRRSGDTIRLVSTRRVARGRYTLTLVVGAGSHATTIRRAVRL